MLKQVSQITFLVLYMLAVLMLSQMPHHGKLAGVMIFGTFSLICHAFSLHFQRSYKTSEMTILNLAYQNTLISKMVFTSRTMFMEVINVLNHDCVISLNYEFYVINYFVSRAVFFYCAEAVFITSFIRFLLLVSPNVFFAIKSESFTYTTHLVVVILIIFELCNRFYLYIVIECKAPALDEMLLGIEIGEAFNCRNSSENLVTNYTVSHKKLFIMNSKKCFEFPTLTILLFIITILELFKVIVEYYQLFLKYKYKIHQVKSARRIEGTTNDGFENNSDECRREEPAIFTGFSCK